MQTGSNTYYSIQFFAWCKRMVILLIALITIVSCKKTFSSNEFIDDKTVVLAEITSGDSMEIPIGKTIKVGSGGIIRFEKVKDATVTIKDGIGRVYNLLPNWSAQYNYNPTTVFTNRRYFRSNTTYFIEINHPTLGIVTASTHIPAIPKIISIDTNFEVYQGRDVLAVSVTLQDEAANENYYIFEALKESVKLSRYFIYNGKRVNYENAEGAAMYDRVRNTQGVQLLRDTIPQNSFTRLNIFTDDNNSENGRINSLNNSFRRIFIPDQSFNGKNYTTRFYVDREFFNSNDVKKKGRVRIQVKCASKELYDYLLVYEKYKTDFGNIPNSQLISPEGNIQNGLGIFGGSSRRERIFYFDNF